MYVHKLKPVNKQIKNRNFLRTFHRQRDIRQNLHPIPADTGMDIDMEQVPHLEK